MKLKVGDKVKFLDEVGGGIILKIEKNNAIILDWDEFEREYPLSKLIIHEQFDGFEDPYDRNSDSPESGKNIPTNKSSPLQNSQKRKLKNTIFEVDLHIEELVDSYIGMSNGEIIQIQLAHFEKKLAWGYRKRLKKIVFIHGIGQGVLKNEIRQRLKAYDFAEFHDASYRNYGHGATEVVFRYN